MVVDLIKYKMEKELVSIITSVYKGEKYLRECIESVLEQDYHNIELIMVDDGSPDNSGKIMDEYAANDCRMKVIHKENSGVSNSRNIALQHSKGKYVCLLDQDDVLAKDYVKFFNYIDIPKIKLSDVPLGVSAVHFASCLSGLHDVNPNGMSGNLYKSV